MRTDPSTHTQRAPLPRMLASLTGVCALLIALLVALVATPAAAQTPQASFSMLGYLQELAIDPPMSNPLAGGRMKVNGVDVRIPANLLIKMPGQYLTVNDLFRGPHPFKPDKTLKDAVQPSGLALADPVQPSNSPVLDRSRAPIPFEV
jgi:hypothetical protein